MRMRRIQVKGVPFLTIILFYLDERFGGNLSATWQLAMSAKQGESAEVENRMIRLEADHQPSLPHLQTKLVLIRNLQQYFIFLAYQQRLNQNATTITTI